MRSFIVSSMAAIGSLMMCFPADAQISATESKPNHKGGKLVSGTYVQTNDNGQTFFSKKEVNGLRTQLVTEGTVTIAADERSVQAISEDGKFEYSREEKGGPEHMVVLKNKNGHLVGHYWIDGEVQDFATAGQAWLAQQLPAIISTTGLGAEARAERLYQEGGAQKVLSFTENMQSGTGRTTMYRYLLKKPDVKTKEIQALLEQIGKVKDSDYEMASILLSVQASHLGNAGVASAYVAAGDHITSNYEKGRVLRHLLAQEKIFEGVLTQAAASIGSMTSDYETRRVLEALAKQPQLSEKQFHFAMEALQNVTSDYERTQGLAPFMRHEEQVVKSFDQVLPLIKEIGSDYEKVKAYSSLLKVSKLGASHYIPLLKASENISSDYEKANLLCRMATQLPKDNKQVQEAYASAAKTVNSKYEYEKVLKAFN